MTDAGERRATLLESVLASAPEAFRETRTPRKAMVSDSGSEMGAEAFRQMRSASVCVAGLRSLTCADASEQRMCTSARPVRDEALQRVG